MSNQAEARPTVATEEHFAYLEQLRASAITNMFCARPYLMDAFPDLSAEEALDVLRYWMNRPLEARRDD
jgi:hypothetical protein